MNEIAMIMRRRQTGSAMMRILFGTENRDSIFWKPFVDDVSQRICAWVVLSLRKVMFPHDHSKCKSTDLRLNIFTAAQWGDLHR
jgi:hypothetical protein